MRYCALLASLLLLPLSLGQSGSKQKAPTQQKSSEAQNIPSVTQAQPPAQHDEGKPERQPPKYPLPVWTDPFWSNWALVLVGVVAAWIALGTLGDLKKQTATAKKSADAAFLNAQAVINTERPWVVVLLLRNQKNGMLAFKASNEGHSPALIIACFAQYAFTGNPDTLPVPPKYGIELQNNVPLLMPNVGHDALGPFIDLYEYDFASLINNDPHRAVAIQNGTSHLVFWFKIVYTTQLAIEAKLAPYETRYCCEYSPMFTTDLKIVGPAEYSKYT